MINNNNNNLSVSTKILYQDEIKKLKEKKQYSFFIKNFFNLFSINNDHLYSDEKEAFLNFFDIEDVTTLENNSSSNNDRFKQQLLQQSNFDVRTYMGFFSIASVIIEKEKFASFTVFPKIILLSYLSRKHRDFFEKYYLLLPKNTTFENLYNIYYFKNNPKIIENHLLVCECDKKINYCEPEDIAVILSSKKYYNKYLSVFKDFHSIYSKNNSNFFFELIYNNSLIMSSNNDFYGIFALYFLVVIFGIIPSKKGICVYSLLYKELLDVTMSTTNYFFLSSSSSPSSLFQHNNNKKKIKELEKIEDKLFFIELIFERENKEGAIIEILFDTEKDDFYNNYLCNFYIFGGIYNILYSDNKKDSLLKHFYKKQRDYIEKIEDNKITFFDFQTRKRTVISFNDLKINEVNLTISFETTLDNETEIIYLSKYTVKKLFNYLNNTSSSSSCSLIFFNELANIIQEEEKLFYNLNLLHDDMKIKLLFKKILTGKNRDQTLFNNLTEEEVALIDKIICFSPKFRNDDNGEIVYYLKNNKNFKEIFFHHHQQEEEEEIQEIAKYFLRKKDKL